MASYHEIARIFSADVVPFLDAGAGGERKYILASYTAHAANDLRERMDAAIRASLEVSVLLKLWRRITAFHETDDIIKAQLEVHGIGRTDQAQVVVLCEYEDAETLLAMQNDPETARHAEKIYRPGTWFTEGAFFSAELLLDHRFL
ncbi:hypothetical protein MKEN_00388200 [Mycena kentingensis (nom. inval.)]|nr:hypothetical protein MKEN_00388200 [Mycena kentingensis (nom. inval.)]